MNRQLSNKSFFPHQTGMTLIELTIVLAILGLVMVVAIPSYQDYMDEADIDQAKKDIGVISLIITDYQLTYNRLPADLSVIGKSGMEDPWGNSYQYINHDTAPKGKRRKDKNLVPINNDYDLFSMGEDGRSVAPLTAKHSRDDIVRANNGKWIGKGEDY